MCYSGILVYTIMLCTKNILTYKEATAKLVTCLNNDSLHFRAKHPSCPGSPPCRLVNAPRKRESARARAPAGPSCIPGGGASPSTAVKSSSFLVATFPLPVSLGSVPNETSQPTGKARTGSPPHATPAAFLRGVCFSARLTGSRLVRRLQGVSRIT